MPPVTATASGLFLLLLRLVGRGGLFVRGGTSRFSRNPLHWSAVADRRLRLRLRLGLVGRGRRLALRVARAWLLGRDGVGFRLGHGGFGFVRRSLGRCLGDGLLGSRLFRSRLVGGRLLGDR